MRGIFMLDEESFVFVQFMSDVHMLQQISTFYEDRDMLRLESLKFLSEGSCSVYRKILYVAKWNIMVD